MADREFLLRIVGDVSSAQKSLGNLEKDVGSFKSTMTNTAKLIGGAFVAGEAIQFGKSMVNAASEQEQAFGAVNSVFGEYADQVHAFGQTTASSLGVAQGEFEQLSTLTGALLKNAGVPMQEVTDSTIDLTARAADLAAMYGGTVPDALAAINSGLKGEMDPLEKFGVSLKSSAVDAKAAALGYVDAEGKVTDYGKQMARIALIMEQSSDAQGTFAAESGTMAGQTAILQAQFKDLQADLGSKLLPVVVKFASTIRALIDFVIKNQSWLVPTAAAIGGIVLAIKAWQMATAAWTVVTEVASGVQLAFNAVMAANPIGLIIIAVAALVAGFVLLYMKVDWFRAAVDATVAGVVSGFQWVLDAVMNVYNWIKDNWPLLLAIITGPIGLAVLAITKNWDAITKAIESALDAIERAWNTTIDALKRAWQAVVDAIKIAWTTAKDFVVNTWNTAVSLVKTAIEGVKTTFQTMVDGVKTIASGIVTAISGPFQDGWDAAKRVLDGVGAILQRIIDGWARIFDGVADLISGPVEAAIRSIKSVWNDTAGGFGFSIPSWVPGVGGKSFKIPRMATGGIVTRPTIALIGEAGPEAVVPLGNSAGFGNVTINVYALTANAEVGRKVWEALREYERATGKAVA